MELIPLRGRGAADNPANRFERLSYQPDPGERDPDDPGPRTVFYRDSSKSVLTRNDSPDVGFTYSVNPYRGCEHGCVYCYARPTHEWLGLSAGLDFETKVFVKSDAPELLRKALMSRRWEPQTIAISGITDCYQPGERKLKVTRGVLEVLAEFRNPVSIITKNHLVTRDADLLGELASHGAAAVHLSVTTLDPELQRVMEPRTSTPQRRLDALRTLSEAGIPVGVMIAPVVPGLTDHEIPAILAAIRDAGATSVGFVPLRLPYGVKDLFERWLEMHFPDRKEKVLNRLRSMHGGKLYGSTFGERMRGKGEFAGQIEQLFEVSVRKVGLNRRESGGLSTAAFRRPEPRGQLGLF